MSPNTAWSHLPNAVHIDRVLASLELYPYHWLTAWGEAWNVIKNEAWKAGQNEINFAAKNEAWIAVRNNAWNIIHLRAWDAQREAAWDALLCLVAYDDCAYMLDSEVGELKILAALGEQKAILLLAACIVFNATKIMETKLI